MCALLPWKPFQIPSPGTVLLRRAWGATLDVLFPPSCGVCGTEGQFLCAACEADLERALPPRCSRCWRQSPGICPDCLRTQAPLDGARSIFLFTGGAQKLVYRLKYESLHALAEPMGELLASYLEQNPLPVDLLAPVPLHRSRQRTRGFNQSELLGRVVARRSGLELDTGSLRRQRNTPQQTNTESRQERERNIRGAFSCGPALEGRRVLLIDDVLTTGATLRECALALSQVGAASAWALTFAFKPRTNEQPPVSGFQQRENHT